MPIRVAVGLGNPGREYAGTRHNVGFMLLDGLVPSGSWRRWREGEAAFHAFDEDGAGLHCFKPLTYMNLSGAAVRAFTEYRRFRPADILVCYDDIDLPLGRLRLRAGGSSGGHRGMQSLLDCFGAEEGIARLRLGVGPLPEGRDAKDYVLGRFRREEEEGLSLMLGRGRAALETAARHGFEKAMNEFNPVP